MQSERRCRREAGRGMEMNRKLGQGLAQMLRGTRLLKEVHPALADAGGAT